LFSSCFGSSRPVRRNGSRSDACQPAGPAGKTDRIGIRIPIPGTGIRFSALAQRSGNMKQDSKPEPCLYARVLGSEWESLPIPIRRFHDPGGRVITAGRFDVDHGTGLLARILASIFRLPRPGLARATTLEVLKDGYSECWE